MAGFGFDAGKGQGVGNNDDIYVVVQVVLTEKFIGTGSGVSSLSNLQRVINEQARKGYRLHTISTTSCVRSASSRSGSISPVRLSSDFSITESLGFVTGCFATNIVQQSS